MCAYNFYGFRNDQPLEWPPHLEEPFHQDNKHKTLWNCGICGKEFKTKTQLDNHVEKHNNDNVDPQKPKSKFQCNQCDKISPNSNALYSHIRQVHCESKYKCHLCTKSFKLEDSLKDHISMHLKSKNYKCTYCDQAFVWRSNMYKHRKQLHRKEWLSEKMKDTN
ncbi:zinc finger imprinted 3-like [Contarinia nasturtii]|uniref:zinc finger imprinted 3-like n=1 Tax=Contarinia nasturtii TaxID=265458 RepID=UPI0012D399CA|nr:zinc finger imprinted 3-like [Contarinia nasturtii]